MGTVHHDVRYYYVDVLGVVKAEGVVNWTYVDLRVPTSGAK